MNLANFVLVKNTQILYPEPRDLHLVPRNPKPKPRTSKKIKIYHSQFKIHYYLYDIKIISK